MPRHPRRDYVATQIWRGRRQTRKIVDIHPDGSIHYRVIAGGTDIAPNGSEATIARSTWRNWVYNEEAQIEQEAECDRKTEREG